MYILYNSGSCAVKSLNCCEHLGSVEFFHSTQLPFLTEPTRHTWVIQKIGSRNHKMPQPKATLTRKLSAPHPAIQTTPHPATQTTLHPATQATLQALQMQHLSEVKRDVFCPCQTAQCLLICFYHNMWFRILRILMWQKCSSQGQI